MTNYVVFKRFTIPIIFSFFSLLESAVVIAYADDIEMNHKQINRAIQIYNKTHDDSVSCKHFDDGSDVTLPELVDVSMLFLDINMPRERGNETLSRLHKEAEAEGFVLPLCAAITTEDDYLLEDGHSEFVVVQGFIFARDKIMGAGLEATFDRVTRLSGIDWFTRYHGRYLDR